MDYIQIRDAVKQKLPGIIDYSRELTDEEVEEQIDELLDRYGTDRDEAVLQRIREISGKIIDEL